MSSMRSRKRLGLAEPFEVLAVQMDGEVPLVILREERQDLAPQSTTSY